MSNYSVGNYPLRFPLYGMMTVENGRMVMSLFEHPTHGEVIAIFTKEEYADEVVKSMNRPELIVVEYSKPKDVRGYVSDEAIEGARNVVIDHIPPRTEGHLMSAGEFLRLAHD